MPGTDMGLQTEFSEIWSLPLAFSRPLRMKPVKRVEARTECSVPQKHVRDRLSLPLRGQEDCAEELASGLGCGLNVSPQIHMQKSQPPKIKVLGDEALQGDAS